MAASTAAPPTPTPAALAVMRNRIVDMSAGAAIDQIVADDPGMVARRSRLTQLARSGQGSLYGSLQMRV
jgi:hypothetical protein